MEHLIANSGIQFVVTEIEFNPSEPCLLDNGKTLKYTFIDGEDFLSNEWVFSLLCPYGTTGDYIPVDELFNVQDGRGIEKRNNGREFLDDAGMVKISKSIDMNLYSTYTNNEPEVISMNNLLSYRVKDPIDGRTQVSAFELLLDKWLPMPMFRKEIDGVTSEFPYGWCRMKMSEIGEGKTKDSKTYRLIWAFDTELSETGLSVLKPCSAMNGKDSEEYALCNKTDLLIGFLSSGRDFHAFSDYIASILGIDITKDFSCKYKAFYIYFINYIRLVGGAPEIVLHENNKKRIFVDLVLDIGNSRTCGILFEEGKFTKGKMLELRNLTRPWISYENKTFDMRIVFRKADFGNDIVLEEEMFSWKSFVRVGEEARNLIYRSLEEEGLSEKTTNYSSPKRYLWDNKKYEGQWENLVTTDDPYNVLLSNDIYVAGMSDMFDNEGNYKKDTEYIDLLNIIDTNKESHHYSRSSLMTFAFMEIFNQAISQINSVKYRRMWGEMDCCRYLRNIIVTCPTAMPIKEQVKLRQCACDAFDALARCNPKLDRTKIIPSPETIVNNDNIYAPINDKVWSYDEASCCQLVYLYAEICERYSGEISRFFNAKGHVREDLKAQGYENKSLTIGTIDIGAGTTDMMICAYECEGSGNAKITPVPLFWDSFYLAGDDILHNIIQNVIIEGKNNGNRDLGNITSSIIARIGGMTDKELLLLPCLDNVVYKSKIDDICMTTDEREKEGKKVSFASNLVHDFFGADSSMMSYIDRRCRIDFNTQISMPMAQKFLDLVRLHRPSKLYSFDELFSDIKPADYLLEYFAHHFGFRFEELNWRFDPAEINEIVKATMEPLMKQLALALYSKQCDVIVLAGRPTSLDAITELFIKYIPTFPNKLVRLNDYRVGSWFPTADGQGYFYDHKSIVSVGAMVGYLASHNGLKGLIFDFGKMISKMGSTAYYIGEFNERRQQVNKSLLTPTKTSTTMTISVFPAFIGCRRLESSIYQARPLYAIYNHCDQNTLKVTLSRIFQDNKEELVLDEVSDVEGNTLPNSSVELIQQSLVDDGKYWLDKGEFELSIK